MQATRPETYEVRCHRCDTSFAPGTRRCIHCGDRLGGRRPRGMLEDLEFADVPEEEEASPAASAGRAGLWVLTAVLMLGGSIFRVCSGGG